MKKILLVFALILLMSGVVPAGDLPAPVVAVSPAGGTNLNCPTFSWSAVEGASSYRIEVYEQAAGDIVPQEQMRTTALPAIEREIAALALSWTPSSGQCLGEGNYVWYVRGLDAQGHGQWSQGAGFRVEPVLSTVAFEERVAGAVEKYLARQQALSAAVQADKPMYEIVETSKAVDQQSLQRTTTAASAITPNATPTTGAAIYLEGDVSLAKSGGRVGIGTDAIGAGLHVTSSDGVLFEGTYGQGAIPKEGGGSRMMWYPGKGVFRAGYASDAEWNDVNVGSLSTAMGYRTTASGDYSTATGAYTIASGYSSTAMVYETNAIGDFSTAMGYRTTASGDYSTATGAYTIASGNYSTAVGGNTTASGVLSTAMGYRTTAASYRETALGSANTNVAGTPDSWVPTDRLFVIGNGTALNALSDAMVVLKNGNVGIGSGTPAVKLDVSGTVKATSGGAADTGMIVQGAVSQTANLQEWQDSAGTVLASVSPSGIFTTNAPKGRAYFSSTGTSIPNNAATAMNFDAEAYNIGNMHDNANPSRFTVPVTGYYRMSAIVWFQTNSTGFRQVYLKKGGTVNLASALIPAANGANTMVVIATADYLSAGDYVEVYALQNSGGDLTAGSGSDATHFTMEYIP